MGQVSSLKNEMRNTNMTKEDSLETFFVKISRLRDDLLAINEIDPKKYKYFMCFKFLGSCTHLVFIILNTNHLSPSILLIRENIHK